MNEQVPSEERDFKPTAVLRWYTRIDQDHYINTGQTRIVKTLQQWWERVYYPKVGSAAPGEWFDVKEVSEL